MNVRHEFGQPLVGEEGKVDVTSNSYLMHQIPTPPEVSPLWTHHREFMDPRSGSVNSATSGFAVSWGLQIIT
ncbi:hypothetical protein N431DRAFT_425106 [Stipitochalara longipes BDJ]|nr:hypothetical protein N431DRAFT_425106 [Stipitochalara longipes BDJ]